MRLTETSFYVPQFQDYATEIKEIAHFEAANIYKALASLSAAVTATSHDSDSSFPFVTISNFEVRGLLNNNLSYALQVTYTPLVESDQLLQWNEYADDKQGWIDESLQQRLTEGAYDPSDRRPVAPLFRYSDETTRKGSRLRQDNTSTSKKFFGPVWQQAPVPSDPAIINFDLLSHRSLNRTFETMYRKDAPALSSVLKLDFLYDKAVIDDATHPHSALFYPIYRDFRQNGSGNIAGFLLAVLPWDNYFSNILPEEISGMVVVIDDTCGDVFTYRIDGRVAHFLGDEDFHEAKYNDLEVATPFSQDDEALLGNGAGDCRYTLHLYPSSEMEAQYRTGAPLLYAGVVAGVFLLTASIFCLYDYMVWRRQQFLMLTTQKTTKIITSLFPRNVRDRILEDAARQASGAVNAKFRLSQFVREENGAAETDESTAFVSQPIADLFPS